MTETLLSPAFLFRFSVPCRKLDKLSGVKSVQLGDEHVVPSFGELEDRPLFADVRCAWSESGVAFYCRVVGKSQAPWCRTSRLEDSDGLQVWIDTRDSHNVHRASRFCHRFVFMPSGSGRRMNEPIADVLSIARAREEPKEVSRKLLEVDSVKHTDGYELRAFVPASCLTGYDPSDHPRLGFTYAVIDRELGWQTFSVGPEFPFMDDPSLWGTLELAGGDGSK